MKPTEFAIGHNVATYVLAVMIVVVGLVSYLTLPREAAPDITIPIVLVTTPYIGVAPSDIETLVTRPIEKELKDLKDVEEIKSTSSEGVSIISVQFQPNVKLDEAIQKMRDKVDKAKAELPKDAEDPTLTEINFSEFPVILVNINGDADMVQLKEVGESLQDAIEQVPGVLKVTLAGGLEREVQVNVDPDQLEFRQLSINDVVRALQRENVNLPGGSIDVDQMSYLVRVDGEFKDASPIAGLVIKDKDGQPITIGDVATVVDGYKEPSSFSRFNGRPNVNLSVQKRAGENLVRITDDVKAILADRRPQLARHGIALTVTADKSEQVRTQVSDLENNILTGLVLVILVLFFFMGGVRNSLFVASAIPLSMLISFTVLSIMGITLNMVVLFSLVLALGMLVDNAIVIVENIYRHATLGKSRPQAALDAVMEVGWPVTTSTITTLVAFAPMLFWPGIMGEFMGFLPLTVIIVLTSSLFVALIINPVLCSTLLAVKPGEAKAEDEVPDNILYRFYRWQLSWALRRRGAIVAIALLAFVGTFVAYAFLNAGVEFFPETTPKSIMVKLQAPDGTNVGASDAMATKLEAPTGEMTNIKNSVLNIGTTANRFGAAGAASNQAQFTIDFLDTDEQTEHPNDTINRVRGIASGIAGVEVELEKTGMGPPSGKPVNIEISGDDFHELGRQSEIIRNKIRDIEGLTDLKDDYVVGRPELQVRVDRKTAALTKVNTGLIANTVRSAINGITATKLRDGEDEIDVVVRLDEAHRATLEDVTSLVVTGDKGAQIPLRELVELESSGGIGSIRHVELDRVVTVTANVEDGFLPNDILKQVQKRLANHKMPDGYGLKYTGENKEQNKARSFLLKALLAALFMITLVLVTQFNSLLQPLVIVASVLLSLIGVLWGLILTQTPFGIIMVGIGVISLAGVVVNNAIVLIDYTNQLRAQGRERQEALLTAGLVRFRPVMLTAVTTVLGLVPMVTGVSFDFFDLRFIVGSRSVEMWGPMARAVAAGLFVATLLTLIVVPVLYSLADDLGNAIRRLFRLGPKQWTGSTQTSRIVVIVLCAGAFAAAFSPVLVGAEEPPAAPERPPAVETVEIPVSRTLSLEQARAEASKNNHDLQLAKQRLKRSRLLADRAWSIILPRASVQASYTRFDKEISFDMPTGAPADAPPEVPRQVPVTIQPLDAFGASGSVSVTLFNGQFFPMLANARLATEIETLAGKHLAREIRFAVTAGYYRLLSLKTLVEIVEGSLAQRETILHSTEARRQAGTAIAFEVTRARTELLKTRQELESTRLSYINARESLAVLIGVKPDFDVAEPATDPEPPAPQDVIAAARKSRGDFLALKQRVDMAENDIEAGWWSYAPTVSAAANASAAETTAFSPERFKWNLMLIGQWSLYDGGLREANMDDKRSQLESVNIEVDKLDAQITADVRMAYHDVRSAKLKRISSAEQVSLAEQALEQAQQGYALGAIQQLDVIGAEIALRIAKANEASNVLAYRLGVQNLSRLSGQ